MKETLNTYEIADRLFRDENAGFSYNGANALAEYLEQLEEDTGEEMEFDRVAIRCDYAEWKTLQEWYLDYAGQAEFDKLLSGFDVMEEGVDEDIDNEIRKYIDDRGVLIEFDGGIIVSSF